ncbi:MAG: lipid-A-disaccharide synthase [Pseudorhodobacter sp.]
MKLYLIAGEASGDRLGAALMAGLRDLHGDLIFQGIAGAAMQRQGMGSLFPMEALSVMGLAEILPRYFDLRARIRQAAEDVLASGARALITIDSPDFCLRVARIVKARRPDLPIIHYVAPSVWAWRPGRAARMAEVVDHVLALLPFEPPYMTAAGMSCDFVGHPVVAEQLASAGERAAFAGEGPLVLTLPGSRRGEVQRMAPVIGQVLARVKEAHPLARVALPTVDGVAGLVAECSASWPIRPDIITDPARKRGAFAAADVALAASGTVSLELAANDCAMVVGYRMNPLTMWLMQRMARIDTVTLVNLVSETSTIPEFLGRDCTAERIAPALLTLLEPQAAVVQRDAMALTMKRLGKGGEAPGRRAARSVLDFLDHADP